MSFYPTAAEGLKLISLLVNVSIMYYVMFTKHL